MNNSLMWRGILILVIVVLLGWSAYPPGESINLGLDLRGGMHLVLQVKTTDALRAETETAMSRLESLLEEEGVQATYERTGTNAFTVAGLTDDEASQVADLLGQNYLVEWDASRSGSTYTFQMETAAEAATRRLAIQQAVQTIRNRIDAFGVTEPVIVPQEDKERVVVQLPGVDDPERVKRLIKNTAFLEFRIVDYPGPGDPPAGSREEILAHYGGQLPQSIEILASQQRDPITNEPVGTVYYAVSATAEVTGRDLKNARPGTGSYGEPVVNFSMNPEGAQKFGTLTGENVGQGLAIVLDGNVVSAPRINSRISDSGLIEGSFTQAEVTDLVTTLRSGALPAGLEYLEERTVGPSLGQDSIDQGLEAGLIGGILVLLTMLVVYRFTGVNAVLMLVLNVILVFGALAYFGATLTLPGIAGIILTIGMAVDANVLVFERIKEELHRGRTVKFAVESGFENARSSVLDANLTTLIAALFLFQFGTGPIRGFAVTLSIGIVFSVFTALFVSRWFFDLQLARPGRVEKLSI